MSLYNFRLFFGDNKKQMKKFQKAFSLIETAVVLVIVAIIIVAAISSAKLIFSSKLSGAQSLTKSSSVNGINGLLMWFEPVMKESFADGEAVDNNPISIWKDINTQSSYKNNVSRTADSNVKYVMDGINGLPSISFSGTNLVNNVGLVGSYISTSTKGFTFFIVSKSDDILSAQERRAFYNGGFDSGFSYLKDATNARGIGSSAVLASGAITGVAEIITVKYSAEQAQITSYFNGIKIVDNASLTLSTCSSSCALVIGNSVVGSNLPWKGLISEIIIFDGVLSDVKRQDVEKYLGKKYGIRIN